MPSFETLIPETVATLRRCVVLTDDSIWIVLYTAECSLNNYRKYRKYRRYRKYWGIKRVRKKIEKKNLISAN